MSRGAHPAPSAAADGDAHVANLRVRQAVGRDLETVLELRLALLREYPDHPIYGRLRPDARERAREVFAGQLRSTTEAIFLAESGTSVAGILRCVQCAGSPLLDPDRYAYISSVYVRPEFRCNGVLRAMIAAAERWSRERGMDEMRLHNVTGRDEAEGAWDALGFAVVEQVRVRRIARPGNR